METLPPSSANCPEIWKPQTSGPVQAFTGIALYEGRNKGRAKHFEVQLTVGNAFVTFWFSVNERVLLSLFRPLSTI